MRNKKSIFSGGMRSYNVTSLEEIINKCGEFDTKYTTGSLIPQGALVRPAAVLFDPIRDPNTSFIKSVFNPDGSLAHNEEVGTHPNWEEYDAVLGLPWFDLDSRKMNVFFGGNNALEVSAAKLREYYTREYPSMGKMVPFKSDNSKYYFRDRKIPRNSPVDVDGYFDEVDFNLAGTFTLNYNDLMRLIKSAKIYSRFAEKDLRKLLNEVSKAENIQRYWNTRSLKLLAVPSLRSIISDNMSGLTLEELSSYIVRYTKAKILASSAGVFYSRSPDISIISAAAIDFDKGDTNKYFSDPGSDGMIHSWKAYDGDFNWGRDRFRSRIRSIYSLIFRACVDNGVDTCVFLPIGLGVFLPKFKFYDARIVEDVIYDYFDISFNMLENIQLETYYLNIGGPNNHPIAHKVLAKYIGREDLGDRIVLGFRHDDMTKSANNIIYQEIVNAADLFFHSDEYYIKTPIKFIHKDVVCVGQQLAIEGKKVALLNASDMIAVVQGRLGYWWETGVGDRFVGEEYLAAFTTMLTSCYNQSSQPIISVNPL